MTFLITILFVTFLFVNVVVIESLRNKVRLRNQIVVENSFKMKCDRDTILLVLVTVVNIGLFALITHLFVTMKNQLEDFAAKNGTF